MDQGVGFNNFPSAGADGYKQPVAGGVKAEGVENVDGIADTTDDLYPREVPAFEKLLNKLINEELGDDRNLDGTLKAGERPDRLG